MFEYELEIKLTIKSDGKDLSETYKESGLGPDDNFDENMDMFVKPRITAGSHVLMKKIKRRLFSC